MVVAFFCVSLVGAPLQARGQPGTDSPVDVGKAIYRRGILGSGQPLVATRRGGLRLKGTDAACLNCHQRSGLGATEGQLLVPPVTLRYLLFDPEHPTREDLDLPYVEGMRITRPPYTVKTIARAIREGIGADGRPLDYMMPHFALNKSDMAALIAYLKRLDEHNTRGVTHTVLHFATIITPDADPLKRKGMLAVLRRFFADKDAAPVGPTPRMRSSRKFKFWVNPRWQLHVWQLKGPARTWKAQLKRDLIRQPVFAVISGLGGDNWAPVHAFCEEEELPCLFPNIEVPPAGANRDFYSLYFSRGVLLEADLIADRVKRLNGAESGPRMRVVEQVYRAGDSGEAAARELAAALRGQGVIIRSRILARGAAGRNVRAAIRRAADADALVLWLRPADIAALDTPPAGTAVVFMSGLMGELEHAPVPQDWRDRVRLTYPVGLPAERRISVDFALGWFRIRHIPIVAERVQANTYLACGVLATTLHQMVDTFVPEYLMERMEGMLDDRIITGYFPHLTLGPHQRFASKGGYIVTFAGVRGVRIVADGPWTVPQPAASAAAPGVTRPLAHMNRHHTGRQN